MVNKRFPISRYNFHNTFTNSRPEDFKRELNQNLGNTEEFSKFD